MNSCIDHHDEIDRDLLDVAAWLSVRHPGRDHVVLLGQPTGGARFDLTGFDRPSRSKSAEHVRSAATALRAFGYNVAAGWGHGSVCQATAESLTVHQSLAGYARVIAALEEGA